MQLSYFDANNGKNIKEFQECFKLLVGSNMVFACIGTDGVILDSLGPMVGTMLKKRNPNLEVYGTLDDPITGLNIKKRLEYIKKNHPNALIVAIDAAMTEEVEEIHKVTLTDCGIKPGDGLKRNYPYIGRYSIQGIVTHTDNQNLSSGRIRHIYNMAEQIVNIIIDSL